MSEANAHTQALSYLNYADSLKDLDKPPALTAAQVYATLAVAEQLDRIATRLEADRPSQIHNT